MSPTTFPHTPNVHRSLPLIALVLISLMLVGPAAAAGDGLRSIHPAGLPRFAPNAAAPDWVAFQEQLFFLAPDSAGEDSLWKSGGTPESTSIVKGLPTGADRIIAVLGTTLLFEARIADGSRRIWRSDGTEAGTIPIMASAPMSSRWAVLGSTLLYFGSSAGDIELWKTDGTEAGTGIVKAINPSGSAIYDPFSVMLIIAGPIAYFGASDGVHITGLWKTDGTETGTTLVKDLRPGDPGFVSSTSVGVLGNVVIFATGGSGGLWRTDGTAAGTSELVGGAFGLNSNSVKLGGALYFAAYTDLYQTELWKSDGTAAGTMLVKDINPGTGSNGGSWPNGLTIHNGQLFFTTCDINWQNNPGGDFNRTKGGLWTSDGTATGTVMVSPPEALFSCGGNAGRGGNPVVAGDTLFYSFSRSLYAVDGTTRSMTLVAPLTDDLQVISGVEVGGALFMGVTHLDANGNTTSYSLWRSDGTPAGTGEQLSPFYPIEIIRVGEQVFFYGQGNRNDPRAIYAASLPDLLAVRGQVSSQTGGSVSTLDGTTTVSFPAGAVETAITVTLRPLAAPTAPTGEQRAVRAFTLEARDAAGQAVTSFRKPLTLTVRYTDAEVAGLYERGLSLAYWDGVRWATLLPCAGCTHDLAANTITVSLDHFTEFALLGRVERTAYLPLISRP